MTLDRIHARTIGSIPKRRFSRLLLRWFDAHKRDLPWRQNADPYRVWLSEVMLQQTRVTAVVEHYQRFLKRFPTVKRLAAARESSVLAVWSGLGYYRRARMLHAAAKTIVREYAGKFPTTAADLQTLPGIGRYTAAAIASIAFNEPVAVVDGNVERVLQRLREKPIAGEQLWQAAGDLLEENRPGDFNQALMELGATVCLPRQPKCLLCPVFGMCATRGELSRGQKVARQRKRQVQYTLDCRNGSIFLVRRPKSAGLMPGMWELPETATLNGTEPLFTLRHSITVTDYIVGVVPGPAPQTAAGNWVAKPHLSKLPLTGLTRKILRAAKLI
ncbi:MAG: A/G-specific adenine glycosylase [Acidobacteriia bacterium]|nr:A/G-specific adenine glycosylase [Terriglobia bacterium]